MLSVAAPAMADQLETIVKGIDAGAEIQRAGREATIVTTAQRVTPHDAPFTEIIPALCSQPESLAGLDKVIVLNSHAFKGVEFWTYDETDDLAGTCEKVGEGSAIQMYSVMH
ncbi:hypothetical protein L861_09020 [Litchfieldella anticariensis FP35 = DSM 16096]|uniref:Uncharacterized protein n=2 Tax=Litchfieldella anticariensis TaxID=258591 RepID=S2KKL8_LITA3|nr:hypothetical protein L861_09020 [Halomonas anticariensis FP35 = DSM 16096]